MKEAMFSVDLSIHDFDGRAVVALRGDLITWPPPASAPGADELVTFGIYSRCDARWRKIQPG
jgi:hypothetical protein